MKLIKICAALLALLCTQPTLAALRGESGTCSSTSVSSFSITYAGASNIQTGDVIIAAGTFAPGGSSTITLPSGFTGGGSLSPALANIFIGGSGYLLMAGKIAVSADDGTPSYTFTSEYAGYWCIQLIALYGRANGSISAAFPNQVATAAGSSGNAPYTYSMTGLTANSGDDVIVISGFLISGFTSGSTYSASLSGYNNLLSTYEATVSNSGPVVSLTSLDNPGGATGTLSLDLTASGSTTLIPAGFVISLPAAASGPPPSQFFLGAKLLPLALPLWIIERRRRLRRLRSAA